jgi:Ala-tRNA(Pro) deacylase
MDDSEHQVGETDVTRRVLAHLDTLGVPYEKLEHEVVTTSEAAAGVRASRLSQGAKALLVKTPESFAYLVISAAERVDNAKLRRILGARKLRFATAEELKDLTGCLPGAAPPFGNLFGLPVYMDAALEAEDCVFFNCGSHTVSLRMGRADLQRATDATMCDFRQGA